MRWDTIIERWTARLAADPALFDLIGDRLYAAQAARPVAIPSVEWMMLSDVEQENFNPITVQVDLWARGIKVAAQIERRIRTLTHRDVAQELGGERLWMQMTDARSLDYPADPGVAHRSLDFVFTPLRERLLTT